MNTKSVFLTMVLTIALTLPVLGQDMQDEKAGTNVKPAGMPDMMGKPTFDATVEGLHLRVWMMTRAQHTEMMKEKTGQTEMHGGREGAMEKMDVGGAQDTMMMNRDIKVMKYTGGGMNRAKRDSMMAGTHHMRLELTDAMMGKAIANASVKVLIVSPAKKSTTVNLTSMNDHFGGSLLLDEKGQYQIAISVTVDNVVKTREFPYVVE
jgi:hypothetical protein